VLDAGIEKTLTDFARELHQLLGEELVAVVLYGSATGVNFVPRQSDFNVAIVVREMRFEVLHTLQPRMAAWHALGFAIPLVIDREFLSHSRDVFPMEFSDIQKHHVLLWGEDIFQNLTISLQHMRFLAEYEARSRLLRLQALYFEHADEPQRLRQIMLDSLKTFFTLMRHLLRLQNNESGQTYAEVLADFEHRFHVTFPRMRQLVAIRVGTRQWSDEPATTFFRDYLTEVQRFVRLIDRLPGGESAV
jgi:predicted nucleotidyltransferase